MNLAEKIRILREGHGWSHSQLARITKIPQPTVWRLEKGVIEYPKLDTLVALAGAFRIPVDDLVREEYELHPTDWSRTNSDVREIVNLCSSLSEQNRELVKRFAQSLSPNSAAEKKNRYVVKMVKASRIRKE